MCSLILKPTIVFLPQLSFHKSGTRVFILGVCIMKPRACLYGVCAASYTLFHFLNLPSDSVRCLSVWRCFACNEHHWPRNSSRWNRPCYRYWRRWGSVFIQNLNLPPCPSCSMVPQCLVLVVFMAKLIRNLATMERSFRFGCLLQPTSLNVDFFRKL